MKKLSKMTLIQFSKKELEDRKMNAIRGGKACPCSACGGCPTTCQLNENGENKFEAEKQSGIEGSQCASCDCPDCRPDWY